MQHLQQQMAQGPPPGPPGQWGPHGPRPPMMGGGPPHPGMRPPGPMGPSQVSLSTSFLHLKIAQNVSFSL